VRVLICTFIGYDKASKAYRFYNLQVRRIIITKNVMFDELTPKALNMRKGSLLATKKD
jgi:hypothetical protein